MEIYYIPIITSTHIAVLYTYSFRFAQNHRFYVQQERRNWFSWLRISTWLPLFTIPVREPRVKERRYSRTIIKSLFLMSNSMKRDINLDLIATLVALKNSSFGLHTSPLHQTGLNLILVRFTSHLVNFHLIIKPPVTWNSKNNSKSIIIS